MVKNGTICPCWKRKMTKNLDQEQTQAVCKNIMMKMVLYVFYCFLHLLHHLHTHTQTEGKTMNYSSWDWQVCCITGLTVLWASTNIHMHPRSAEIFFLRATQQIFKWRNVTKNKTQCILISCCQFGDILLFQPCFHYWPVLNRLELVPLTIIKMRSLVRDTFPQNKMVDA